jgi:hypothetical protein
MRVQASLPDDSEQYVTILAFGDVAIENQFELVELAQVEVTITDSNALVRHYPSSDGFILGALEPGTVVTATGRLDDNSWLRITIPETQDTGWVHASLLGGIDGADIEMLAVVEPGKPYYRPMQAVLFTSGAGGSPCAEAPPDGMLIQTPEGTAEVRMLINEVAISMSATAFVQTEPEGDLSINMLSGSGTVTVNGQSQPIVAGTRVRVAMGEDGRAVGVPGYPQPYDADLLGVLPTSQLTTDVEFHEPLSYAEINALMGVEEEPAIDPEAAPETTDEVVDPVTGEPVAQPPPADDGGDDGHPDSPPGLVDNPALGDDGPPGQNKDKDK